MAARSLLAFSAVLLPLIEAHSELLTLNDAASYALANAPASRIARAQLDEATARRRQSESAFLPMLTVSSSYFRTNNPVQAFSFALNQGEFSLASDVNNPQTADNLQLSAQVRWRILSMRDIASRRSAGAAERGAQKMLTARDNEIVLHVTRAYLNVLVASEFVDAAEAAVEAFTESEKVMFSRVHAGTVLKTELLNIQVERARAEEQQIRASNALTLAHKTLALALGMDSLLWEELTPLRDLHIEEPAPITAETRPEIAARDAYVAVARAQLNSAKAGYLPSVSVIAGADHFRGWESDGSKGSWSAGIMAEWSIFDGFFTPSQVSEKRAHLRMAEEEARQIRLQSSLELATAKANSSEASERVAVMTRAVELAEESANLIRLRLDQGLVLSSQLIDAENALVQARAGLAQAQADRLYAIASLRRALNLDVLGE